MSTAQSDLLRQLQVLKDFQIPGQQDDKKAARLQFVAGLISSAGAATPGEAIAGIGQAAVNSLRELEESKLERQKFSLELMTRQLDASLGVRRDTRSERESLQRGKLLKSAEVHREKLRPGEVTQQESRTKLLDAQTRSAVVEARIKEATETGRIEAFDFDTQDAEERLNETRRLGLANAADQRRKVRALAHFENLRTDPEQSDFIRNAAAAVALGFRPSPDLVSAPEPQNVFELAAKNIPTSVLDGLNRSISARIERSELFSELTQIGIDNLPIKQTQVEVAQFNAQEINKTKMQYDFEAIDYLQQLLPTLTDNFLVHNSDFDQAKMFREKIIKPIVEKLKFTGNTMFRVINGEISIAGRTAQSRIRFRKAGDAKGFFTITIAGIEKMLTEVSEERAAKDSLNLQELQQRFRQ